MPTSPQVECTEVARTCLCFNLRRTGRVLTQLYDGHLRPTGLRATQLTVLVGVRLAGPTAIQPLSDVLGMDRTTLTRNLKALETNGLVSRARGDDRRVRLVELTEAGEVALAAALPHWRQAHERALALFGEDTVRHLVPVLKAIAKTAQTASG